MSFVVDWFVNIGSVIERLTDLETDSFEFVNEYQTITIHGIGNTVYSFRIDPSSTSELFSNETQITMHPCEFLTIRRQPYKERLTDSQRITLDAYAPVIQSKFNLSKVATLFELVAQRLL